MYIDLVLSEIRVDRSGSTGIPSSLFGILRNIQLSCVVDISRGI